MQDIIDTKITNKLLQCERCIHHHKGRYRSQESILRILEENGPISQKQLQETLNIKSGSLSELLSKLEKQGYIDKHKDSNDARAYILSINTNGKKKLTDIKRKGADIFYENMSEEEKKQLFQLLCKIKLT